MPGLLGFLFKETGQLLCGWHRKHQYFISRNLIGAVGHLGFFIGGVLLYYITCESWHENISSYQYSLLDQIIDIIGIGERGAWWVHFFPKMGPKQPKIAG